MVTRKGLSSYTVLIKVLASMIMVLNTKQRLSIIVHEPVSHLNLYDSFTPARQLMKKEQAACSPRSVDVDSYHSTQIHGSGNLSYYCIMPLTYV